MNRPSNAKDVRPTLLGRTKNGISGRLHAVAIAPTLFPIETSSSVRAPVFSIASLWHNDCQKRPMGTARKVLIVEDDVAMAQMCAKLVRRQGHIPMVARSCRQALSLVRENADIDAVLSDIQMPNMSGIELLTQLQELDTHLPVILMTGYANIISAAEALSLGALDYLSKPFDAETLICSLERAFQTRRAIMA
jgi:CheY-like chemotaxis protein